MEYTELIKNDLKKILLKEKLYELPSFLQLLRKTYGLSRLLVAKHIGMHPQKLLYLEYGKFIRPPLPDHLRKMATYYGIPEKILLRKSSHYIRSKMTKRWHGRGRKIKK